MTDIANEVTDEAINKALGFELRRIRDDLELTRGDVVEYMSTHSEQTLANYECGIRPMTLPRLVEICEALGVATASVVALALQRAEIEPNPRTCIVDFSAIMAKVDRQSSLAQWARNRLKRDPDATVVELELAVIEEMAVILDVPYGELVEELRSFTPERVPPRIVWVTTG